MRHGEDLSSSPQKRLKLTTVYDAVAGRANYEGYLSAPRNSKHRDRASTTLIPIPPEEVLFRRADAPDRYEENDIYFSDRHLDQANELHRLPDSDLTKALHAYVSDFYGSLAEDGIEDGVEYDWESLDETALLALGILIEEAAAQMRVDDVATLPDEPESPSGGEEESVRDHIKTESDEQSMHDAIKTESDIESRRSDIKAESDEESMANEIKVETDN